MGWGGSFEPPAGISVGVSAPIPPISGGGAPATGKAKAGRGGGDGQELTDRSLGLPLLPRPCCSGNARWGPACAFSGCGRWLSVGG